MTWVSSQLSSLSVLVPFSEQPGRIRCDPLKLIHWPLVSSLYNDTKNTWTIPLMSRRKCVNKNESKDKLNVHMSMGGVLWLFDNSLMVVAHNLIREFVVRSWQWRCDLSLQLVVSMVPNLPRSTLTFKKNQMLSQDLKIV